MDRRTFLQRSAATVGALSLAPLKAFSDEGTRPSSQSVVQRYVPLGRTGLKMSDISFGATALNDPRLVHQALDRGINYFDTSDSYPLGYRGVSEQALGEALAGRRQDVILTSKTKAEADEGKLTFLSRLEGSLRRLRTDYIDIYLNHAVNDVARVDNDAWWEFVERAKEQGKIRFTGMSGHGGHLIRCLDHGLDRDLFDVILAAHNFGSDPAFYEKFTKKFDLIANQVDLPRVLEKAHAKGVGVIVMKTLMGAKLNDMRPYEREGGTFSQAAFRWVLANPNVDALIVTMKSPEQMDEYLAASGARRVGQNDIELLQRYAQHNGSTHCRQGCGLCLDRCSEGSPIDEILRAGMYATDYGDLELARGTYAALGAAATQCLDCTTQSCAGACPAGIDIPGRTRSMPDLLGLG